MFLKLFIFRFIIFNKVLEKPQTDIRFLHALNTYASS